MKITTEIKKEWAKVEELVDYKFVTEDLSTFYKDLDILDKDSTKKARRHFQPWLAILELGIVWMSVFHTFLREKSKEDKFKEDLSILSTLAGASCTHAVSIRRLCLSGLDSSARVVLRSLMESTQYFLVMLIDPEIRKGYKKLSEIEDLEYKHSYKFWRDHLTPKKINKVLQRIEQESFSTRGEYFANFYKQRREENYTWSSQFVHPSSIAAFLSTISISVDDNLVYTSIIGGVPDKSSVTTLHLTNEAIFYFSYLVQQLVFIEKGKYLNLGKTDKKNYIDMIAYWGPSVFHQIFVRHQNRHEEYINKYFPESENEI